MSLKIDVESKIEPDPCVLAWNGEILFVGTEDGFIKSFDEKLSPSKSWQAHGVQLFALASDTKHVYSASNDGGVRVWDSFGQKITEHASSGADIGILRVQDNLVLAGDEAGNVTIYENNVEKTKYNFLEEVKDVAYRNPLIFTVRDLDVTVTEIKPDESKTRFTTRHTMEGRAPLRLVGSKLLVMARGGNDLRLYDTNIDSGFKLLYQVKVSEMIVTSISTNGDTVWTAGWDGIVRRWKIVNDKIESFGELNLGSCVNGLEAIAPTVAFAILSGGKLLRIKAE